MLEHSIGCWIWVVHREVFERLHPAVLTAFAPHCRGTLAVATYTTVTMGRHSWIFSKNSSDRNHNLERFGGHSMRRLVPTTSRRKSIDIPRLFLAAGGERETRWLQRSDRPRRLISPRPISLLTRRRGRTWIPAFGVPSRSPSRPISGFCSRDCGHPGSLGLEQRSSRKQRLLN
jgi:hypothetical protein